MENFGIRIVFDRKGETKKNPKERALIHIEVTDKDTRRKRYISTGVKILANQYSTSGGFSIKNHPNAIILKARVNSIYDEVEAFIYSDKCKGFDDIYNWNKEEQSSMTFLEFFEQEMGRRSQSGISDDSWRNHRTLFSALNRFGKIVLFKDLTYTNLVGFDVFLKKTINSQPVIYKRHQMLKSYITGAIKRKLTNENPYDRYKCKKGKSKV